MNTRYINHCQVYLFMDYYNFILLYVKHKFNTLVQNNGHEIIKEELLTVLIQDAVNQYYSQGRGWTRN